MLLAWLVIFLHGIIPHNHQSQRTAHCHNVFHHDHAEDDTKDLPAIDKFLLNAFESDHSRPAIICHFTSELVNNAGTDHFFTYEDIFNFTSPALSSGPYFPANYCGRVKKPSHSLMPLRAPPRA